MQTSLILIGVGVVSVLAIGLGLGIGLGGIDDTSDTTNTTFIPSTTRLTTGERSNPDFSTSTTPVETTQNFTTPDPGPPVQYLAYTVYSNPPRSSRGPIYVHEIIDSKLQKYRAISTPYYARNPYLTFNVERNVLEIAGDAFDTNIYNHYFINLENVTSEKVDPTYFRGRMGSKIIYTPEFGTIQVGGSWGSSYADVINITPLLSMNGTVKLPDLLEARHDFAAKYYQGKLFIAGGTGGQNIQVLDLFEKTADQLEWVYYEPLSVKLESGNIQFFGNLMYAFGSDNTFMEVYNIALQETVAFHENAFKSKNSKTASFLVNGTLNVVGGYFRRSSSTVQEMSEVFDVERFTVVSPSKATYATSFLEFCNW